MQKYYQGFQLKGKVCILNQLRGVNNYQVYMKVLTAPSFKGHCPAALSLQKYTHTFDRLYIVLGLLDMMG